MSYSFYSVVFGDKEKGKRLSRFAIYSLIGIPFLLIYIVIQHVKWGFNELLQIPKGQKWGQKAQDLTQGVKSAAPKVKEPGHMEYFSSLEVGQDLTKIIEGLLTKFYRISMKSRRGRGGKWRASEYIRVWTDSNSRVYTDDLLHGAPAEKIRKKAYRSPLGLKGAISRNTHGVLHATRVLFLAYSFNEGLKNLLGDPLKELADKVKTNPMHLLCAPLLHDSGREGGGKDLWDHKSGENVTMFLKDKGVPESWAYLIGLYTAHKDRPDYAKDYILDRIGVNCSHHRETQNNVGKYPYSGEYLALESRVKEGAKGIVSSHHGLLSYIGLLSSLSDCADIQRCKPKFQLKYFKTGVNNLLSQVGISLGDDAKEDVRKVCFAHVKIAEDLIAATGDVFKKKDFMKKVDIEKEHTVSQVSELAKNLCVTANRAHTP